MFQRIIEFVRTFRERGPVPHGPADGLRAGGMQLDAASSSRALGTKPIERFRALALASSVM